MSVLELFRLDGATAVVTGGGKGIGRGIAIALAQAGANILVAARTAADLDETKAQIAALGKSAAALAIDVTAEGAMDLIAARAIDQFLAN